METKKVKCLDSSVYGMNINIAEVGLVKVSEKGIVEVPKEFADSIVENSPDFEFVEEDEKSNNKPKSGKKGVKEVEKEEEDKELTEDDEKETEKEVVEEDEKKAPEVSEEEIRKSLEAKLAKDLVKIINKIDGISDKKKKEITKNKALMIEFLINNVDLEDLKEII